MKRVALAISLLLMTSATQATEVLSFGQSQAGTSPITATVSAGITTIMASEAPITVTSCLLCSTIVGSETLTLDAVSVGVAHTFNGFVVQGFTGTFEIVSSTGQNILSGTFTDATFGAGTSLTLSASNATAGERLTLTSGVMKAAALAGGEAASMSFADVTPQVSVVNGTMAPFKASVAGTFSGGAPTVGIPEPATFGLLALALAASSLVAHHRRRRMPDE